MSGVSAGEVARRLRASDPEVWTAVDQLPAREKRIIERRYGRDGGPMESVAEVSSDLIITMQRVKEIEDETLKKIGKIL